MNFTEKKKWSSGYKGWGFAVGVCGNCPQFCLFVLYGISLIAITFPFTAAKFFLLVIQLLTLLVVPRTSCKLHVSMAATAEDQRVCWCRNALSHDWSVLGLHSIPLKFLSGCNRGITRPVGKGLLAGYS